MITVKQKDKGLAEDKWLEMLAKGKRLMTAEQWEEFAYCLHCGHKKCLLCVRETIAIADIHISQFDPVQEGVDLESFLEGYPTQLHDQVIRCCACCSRGHIIDWLGLSFWPESEDFPEIERAILRVALANENQN